MPPSKQFINIRARQTRLYTSISEDRMELLLDRFRASQHQDIDWVGVLSAAFATVVSFIGLWDAWKGSPMQIVLLVATTVFGSIVTYHVVRLWRFNKARKPMTNEEFLAALAEEQEEEPEQPSVNVDKASVSI